MDKIIGVVIPPELKAEFIEVGRKHGCTVIEPHIALISHEMLKGAGGVERNLQSFCLSQPSFKTIIGGPNIEIREGIQVFFLTVMMGALNTTRDKLIRHLKLPPYSGVFRPYVSLVEHKEDNASGLDGMLAEVKAAFSKPRSINVDALAIYKRSGKNEPYKMDTAYPFTGK